MLLSTRIWKFVESLQAVHTRNWRWQSVFNADFDQILHFVLLFYIWSKKELTSGMILLQPLAEIVSFGFPWKTFLSKS